MAVVYKADRAQPLPFTTPKDPSDVAAYTFQWGNELATGETLSSSTTTVDTGLTKDSEAISGTDVNVTVSGGTAGRKYKLRCQVVTSTSRTLEITGVVCVANR